MQAQANESLLKKFAVWVQETTVVARRLATHVFKPYPRIKYLEHKWKDVSQSSGYRLRCYILNLGIDGKSDFYNNITSFIDCTRSSYERDPAVVLANVRQFITGMKNYLLKNGGKKFDRLHQKAEQNDKDNSFNLDDIFESVLYELVVEPMHDYIVDMLADECYTNVVNIIRNSKVISQYSLQDLGLKLEPYSEEVMKSIRENLQKMQQERNPIDKLQSFLGAVTIMLKSAISSETGERASLCADLFVPLLVWMLAKCGIMTGEMESMYIWGLLNPNLHSGELGYYLTSMMTAVAVMKEPARLFETYTEKPKCMWQTERIQQDRNTVRILVPDEYRGMPCVTKTLRGMPNYTARHVCQSMARKLHIKNPELYGLFKLVNGEASLVGDNVDLLRVLNEEIDNGNLCFFIYNPHGIEFNWLYQTTLECCVTKGKTEVAHFLLRYLVL